MLSWRERVLRATATAAALAVAVWLAQALALAGVWTSAVVAPSGGTTPAPWPVGRAVPQFSHVFLIVMENRSPASVLSGKTSYLSLLAHTYALSTNDWALAHPSLPNYLALIGGSTFGRKSDCASCWVRGPNLVDRLEARHVSWSAYFEGLPATGWLGASNLLTLYAGKHNPFRYFQDIRQNPARRKHLRPLPLLWPALRQGTEPRFVWITPNLCHDMHSCPAWVGDAWLKIVVPRILASASWRRGGVLFITFDEGTMRTSHAPGAGGPVSLLAISPNSRGRGNVTVLSTHMNLLATIEAALGVGCVGRSCSAAPLSDLFVRSRTSHH